MRVGILVLAYMAEDTIAGVLSRIPEAVYRRAEGIYVFDDASADHTSENVVSFKAQSKNGDKIHLIQHNKNLGYGGNQKFSYRFAAEKGLDVVVMLHGDGQYAPELLEQIYTPLLEDKADLVFGSRMRGHPLGGRMPVHKFVGNVALTKVQNWLTGARFSEFHSGYRAFRVKCLNALPLEKCTDGFHFDTQILILFLDRGHRTLEVPIPTFYGDEISRVRILSYGVNVLKESLDYRLTKMTGQPSLYSPDQTIEPTRSPVETPDPFPKSAE